MYAFIYALSGYNIILTDINKDFEIQINNFEDMPLVGKSRCEGLESHDFLSGKMAAILVFFHFFQIFKKLLLNIRLYDVVAKYEDSNSISEVIGAKKRFFLKNTKKW